jgi:hypothetical protein
MRCRECAVEVAARLGSAPGAGLRSLGSRVMVGTVVADMVVGAVSDTAVIDAAGKAVPAGVAGQAPAETYSRILLDLAIMLVFGWGLPGRCEPAPMRIGRVRRVA